LDRYLSAHLEPVTEESAVDDEDEDFSAVPVSESKLVSENDDDVSHDDDDVDERLRRGSNNAGSRAYATPSSSVLSTASSATVTIPRRGGRVVGESLSWTMDMKMVDFPYPPLFVAIS
jgi:hypothetical protein